MEVSETMRVGGGGTRNRPRPRPARRLSDALTPTRAPSPLLSPPPSPQGGKGGSQWVASGGATGTFPPDPRVTLLFDLNGVLLVNPRNAAGVRVARLRPHAGEALARLAGHFRLGVYSSATTPTVLKALASVAAAVGRAGSAAGAGAGPASTSSGEGAGGASGSKLFELILCRKYCRPAPTVSEEGGGGWRGGDLSR